MKISFAFLRERAKFYIPINALNNELLISLLLTNRQVSLPIKMYTESYPERLFVVFFNSCRIVSQIR
jgi:hypothetical protein